MPEDPAPDEAMPRSTAELMLLGDPLCPFLQRIAIVLNEKQAAYDLVFVDASAKPGWLLKVSPNGKSPLLRVARPSGQVILFESLAICEYLDETCGPTRLHPSDALARAAHRAWMEHCSSALADAWKVLLVKDAAAAALAQLRSTLDRLEGALAGPYFAGAAFCMVDAVMAPVFRYFDVLVDPAAEAMIDGLPRLAKWRRALADRPSVKAAVTPDYADRLRSYIARMRAS